MVQKPGGGGADGRIIAGRIAQVGDCAFGLLLQPAIQRQRPDLIPAFIPARVNPARSASLCVIKPLKS
jgi:hypothetical protein